MRNLKRKFALVICLSVVLLLPGLTEAENLKLRITVEKAKVLLRPNPGSTVLREFLRGEILESDKQIGEWFRVILPPGEKGALLTGFVHFDEVELINEKFVEDKPGPPQSETIEPPKPTPPYKYQPTRSVLQPSPEPPIGTGLKFYGAWGYVLASDINDDLQATTDYWNDRDVEVDGEFKPLHTEYEFGGEFIIKLTPQIGIGLGAGHIQTSSESTVRNVWFGYSYQDTANIKVTAIPLTMSAYFGLPLSKKFNLIAQVGLGYYLGKLIWSYGYDSEFDVFEENFEGKSTNLGFHGSLGLEFNFSSKFALVVEGFGRYAKLKGLVGDYTFAETLLGSQTQETINEATFWIYEWRSSLTDKSYPTIEFNDEEPRENSFISKVREGEVDLTGLSIRVGIKIRF